MSKKIKYWCDSGANIHSCRKGEITLEALGFTEEEWLELTDEQQELEIKEIALERFDWGFTYEGDD